MTVNRHLMPVIVVIVLLGIAGLAQATGQWASTGAKLVESGNLTPADLRGWMTIQQVADGLYLPVAAIEGVVAALSSADGRLSALREFRLFDVYRPRIDSSKVAEASANALLNKEKSLAFRVVLQDTDRALNDADADAAVSAIVEGLEKQCGARLRR